jgi:hypothetical protein
MCEIEKEGIFVDSHCFVYLLFEIVRTIWEMRSSKLLERVRRNIVAPAAPVKQTLWQWLDEC